MKQKISFVLVAVLLLALCLSGCKSTAKPAMPEVTATAVPTAAPTPEPTPEPTAEPTPEPTPVIEKAKEIVIPAELDPDNLVPLLSDLTIEMVEESGKYTQMPGEDGGIYYYQSANLLGRAGMAMIMFGEDRAPMSIIYAVYETPNKDNYGEQVDYFQKLRAKMSELCGAPFSSLITLPDGTEAMNYTTQDIAEAISNGKTMQFTDTWLKKAGANIIVDLTLTDADITFSLFYTTDAYFNDAMLNEA